MNAGLSPNTQAILLLTAPLVAGRGEPSSQALTPGEYKRLALFLRDRQREPADLVGPEADALVADCRSVVEASRLRSLLDRGFLLSQAVERWQARAIWVVSRADTAYPQRLKERLRNEAPAVLYGCGDAAILETGGLAVVGSRQVDDGLAQYAAAVGGLAGGAGRTLVSGAARGIDQAAMRGALEAGGKVAGVVADSLERMVLNREHRNLLMAQQLVLISPYDPAAGFNVGHAMQRNKLIYALADAALVVSADYEKGGTWAGAVEQLEKLHYVPVFVRAGEDTGKGLEALHRKGALHWPNPTTPDDVATLLDDRSLLPAGAPGQGQLGLPTMNGPAPDRPTGAEAPRIDARVPGQHQVPALAPADELFAKVRSLLERMDTARTEAEVAAELGVSKGQAREWLHRLVAEGVLSQSSRPARYRVVRSASAQASLFDAQ